MGRGHREWALERSLLLRGRAARMREMSTRSEAALWTRLRNKQLGVHFRRQVPLLDAYIVDFLCISARLIVEVDGDYHQTRQRYDSVRDHRLEFAGYRILRVSATLVLTDMPAAIAFILSALQVMPPQRPKSLRPST